MRYRRLLEWIRASGNGPLPVTRRTAAIGGPLAVILGSEALIYSGRVGAALWGYLLLFVGCTLAPLVFDQQSALFRAFVLVPLFRLLNLGMPVLFETTLAWLALVYGPLLFAAYILAGDNPAVNRPTLRDLGRAMLHVPVLLVVAAGLASVEYLILEPGALVPSWNVGHALRIVVVMVLLVGFTEEFVFRGILQQTIEATAGRFTGIALSSLVFGVMHSSLQLPGAIAFGVGVGVFYALLYDWTDNLVIVTILHGTQNVFLFAVFPLLGPIVTL